jgi:hypothetical protein
MNSWNWWVSSQDCRPNGVGVRKSERSGLQRQPVDDHEMSARLRLAGAAYDHAAAVPTHAVVLLKRNRFGVRASIVTGRVDWRANLTVVCPKGRALR